MIEYCSSIVLNVENICVLFKIVSGNFVFVLKVVLSKVKCIWIKIDWELVVEGVY